MVGVKLRSVQPCGPENKWRKFRKYAKTYYLFGTERLRDKDLGLADDVYVVLLAGEIFALPQRVAMLEAEMSTRISKLETTVLNRVNAPESTTPPHLAKVEKRAGDSGPARA